MNKFSCILMGDSGTGKTSSVATLAKTHEVFILSFESGNEIVLKDTDPSRVHWAYVAPQTDDVDDIYKSLLTFGNMNEKEVANYVPPPMDIKKTPLALALDTLKNFKCVRCGKEFGNVKTFTQDQVFVIDGLTGLSEATKNYVVKNSPKISRNDYGDIQEWMKKVIFTLLHKSNASLILIAHQSSYSDDLSGTKIGMLTYGNKLIPALQKEFDEIVVAKRTMTQDGKIKFYWSNNEKNTITKHRYLPLSSDLTPSFTHFTKETK